MIPSQKRRKIIDKDTTITAQYVDNFVITVGYPNPTNLDETIVNTLSISEPIFYNLDHSDETTLDTKPKLDDNEGALTQLEVSIINQYTHLLLKESLLCFFDDTPMTLLSDYYLNCGYSIVELIRARCTVEF